MNEYDEYAKYEEAFVPKPPKGQCQWHKLDTVLRPGRWVKAELKYRGNSSMAPRYEHKGKGKTLRTHRPKKNKREDL